jgi:hypothetical protein
MLGKPGVLTMINTGDGPIVTRRIYFSRPHADSLQPSWFGDSVGHREGDTLVVDTIAFNNETWLSTNCNRHGEDMRVTERWRFVEKDILEHVATIDDPRTLTSPVTRTWYYKMLATPSRRTEKFFKANPMRGGVG